MECCLNIMCYFYLFAYSKSQEKTRTFIKKLEFSHFQKNDMQMSQTKIVAVRRHQSITCPPPSMGSLFIYLYIINIQSHLPCTISYKTKSCAVICIRIYKIMLKFITLWQITFIIFFGRFIYKNWLF